MAENIENNGCSQRDNAEHEGYVKASRSFNRIWKERDSAQPRLLETILYKDNFNRAYKRVKANKGAPGIDGMTIEEALPYLKEHQQEITDRIYRGKYTPSPVRRVEIPKPDGGVRKLGIPTVIDRTLQQAITQQLVPIYEPLFADGSYGYRPNRSAKDAILKVKEYAEQGYTFAVVLDLSKYFDTLNHEILINLLRKNVKDERVVQLIKRYLKSGVMENGVVIDTEEGSPQGGNLSPLLANIYLNEFDQEYLKRGVPCIRYADDIVLLAKSKRASERLLESSTKYLEERLKLTVNREKSRTVSVFAIRNFKFLGFALGRNGKGTYVRVHSKSWKKFKSRLKELSSRKRCQSIKQRIKHYENILPEVAQHTSTTERRADDAERDTDKQKMVEYMSGHIGEEYEGVISSITSWGIYVELPNTIEGMISVASLKDGYYVYDENHYEMVNETTNKTYKLGQKIKVVVVSTDKILRTIDFEPA